MVVFRWFDRAARHVARVGRVGAFSAAMLVASVGIAADTVQNFDAIFPPGGGGNAPALLPFGPVAIIDGWDGQALRLTTEVNDQNTGVAMNQTVAGNYSELRVDFQMSFSPGNGGGADGMGFAYANASIYGPDNSSGFPGWGTSEEPMLAGSLGIGFDTFNNADLGDGGENSVSVHFDNVRLDSVSIDASDIGSIETGSPIQASVVIAPTGTGSNLSVVLTDLDSGNTFTAYDNFFVDGLTPYDGRPAFKGRTGGANSEQSIDNIALALTPVGGGAVQTSLENFESYEAGDITAPPVTPNPPLVGGTPFTEFQGGTDPPVRIKNTTANAGAQPGFLQLTDNIGGQSNSIAFDRTSDVADNIEATFKFKINNSGNNADGMSFLLLDADTYGNDGELTGGFSEEPSLAGALGIGFDTFDNDEEGALDGDPEGCGAPGTCLDRRANHFSLHWDGAKVGENVLLDQAAFDLVNNEWNELSLIATQVEGGMNVTLVVTDGTDGSVHVVFADEFLDGASFPNGARAAFGGRTGGAASVQAIDDLLISWTGGGLLGDFNNNGSLDVGDIDDLTGQSASGANNAGYDLNGDSAVNFGDISIWIKDLKNSWIGDANLDGEFSSSDLVVLFGAGTYETATPAVWSSGDFDGNGLFTTSDLVAALGDGGYENGPRAAVAAVPEPSSLVLLALGSLMVVRRRQK